MIKWRVAEALTGLGAVCNRRGWPTAEYDSVKPFKSRKIKVRFASLGEAKAAATVLKGLNYFELFYKSLSANQGTHNRNPNNRKRLLKCWTLKKARTTQLTNRGSQSDSLEERIQSSLFQHQNR